MPVSDHCQRTLAVDRASLVEWYLRNRERSRRLFDLIDPEVYYTRPIALRNPIVFYEGHLPAFSVIAFLKRGLGRPGVDERLERLFARGIDPDSVDAAVPRSGASTLWPDRARGPRVRRRRRRGGSVGAARCAVRRGSAGDAARRSHLHRARARGDAPGDAALHVAPAAARAQAEADRPRPTRSVAHPSRRDVVRIPAGRATLGAERSRGRFGWDNEFGGMHVDVPAFDIDVHNVTNAEFLEFVEAGGYRTRELWTDDRLGVARERAARTRSSGCSAVASGTGTGCSRTCRCRWRGRSTSARPRRGVRALEERRLPTEAEYHRAAFGTPEGDERQLPWGDAPPDAVTRQLRLLELGAGAGRLAPGGRERVGRARSRRQRLGVDVDRLRAVPWLQPMASYPEYSADFFDGQHYVMKGASPATAKELVRRSFRNWFRPNYPYVYATFRTVAAS